MSPQDIVKDSFKVFRGVQKGRYARKSQAYRKSSKLMCVLLAGCWILYALTHNALFLWVSNAYCITGVLSTVLCFHARRRFRFYEGLSYDDNSDISQIRREDCFVKPKYVLLGSEKFTRIGCTVNDMLPCMFLVKSGHYQYVVDVTTRDPNKQYYDW